MRFSASKILLLSLEKEKNAPLWEFTAKCIQMKFFSRILHRVLMLREIILRANLIPAT